MDGEEMRGLRRAVALRVEGGDLVATSSAEMAARRDLSAVRLEISAPPQPAARLLPSVDVRKEIELTGGGELKEPLIEGKKRVRSRARFGLFT